VNNDLERPVRVWLKVDSGMHRLGVTPAEVRDVHARLRACPSVLPDVGLLSHLGRADERDSSFTREQLGTFVAATSDLRGERSLASSAGVLAWRETHLEWVRPGIMLYGVSPFPGAEASEYGLLPAMTLETRLIAVRRLRAGDAVGYGGTWTAPVDMDVGVAAIGYGDGYPRHAPGGTPVLVDGVPAPLIGRVSMDMITIDLRGVPRARWGSSVVLWGRGLPVERIAQACGTIPYTLLCAVKTRIQTAS
jgi:alanine racemase